MSRGVVYLTGRMLGIPLYNFPLFDAVAARLRAMGWTVINPAELDRSEGFDPESLPADHDWGHFPPNMDKMRAIRRDLQGVLNSTHFSQITPDLGRGSTAEIAVARWKGCGRVHHETGEELPDA